MPNPLPRLAVLAQAFDIAYQACAREAAHLPPRQQSDVMLSAVARFCFAQAEAGCTCDDIVEGRLIGILAGAAQDPVQLTRLIAAINAEAEDDDFPAARLDPRNRKGWGRDGRIIAAPPWSQPTDELLAELRFGTDGLHGERLYQQLRANITDRAPVFIVSDPRARADPDMIPVSLVAAYFQAFEHKIRDLEDALFEAERSPYAEP
jgi:hypothetical protein